MKLIELRMNNFMPYKGECSISFPQSDSQNILVIFGANMRGKTSFFNAIRWCLYGKAVGRHSKKIPNHYIFNKEAASEGDWSFSVQLVFEEDGKKYELVRAAKRKDLVGIPSRHEDVEVTQVLRINGQPIASDQILHEINNVAPEPVSRFFLFDGELLNEYEELLIQGSTQGENIKKSIEQVLGVPSLVNGRADLQALLNEAQKEQARDAKKVDGLKSIAQTQTTLQARLDAQKDNLSNLIESMERTQSESDRLEDILSQSQVLLTKKAELESLQKKQSDIANTQNELLEERKDKFRDAWKLLLDTPLSRRRSELEEASAKLQSRLVSDGALKTQINSIQALVSKGECPTCKQEIGQKTREEAQRELDALTQLKRESGNVAAELSDISGQLADLRKVEGPGTRFRLIEIEKQIAQLEIEGIRTANEIEDIRAEIEGKDTSELEITRTKYKRLIGELARLKGDVETAENDIKDIQNKMDANSRKMDSHAGATKTISSIKVKVCAELEDLFSSSIGKLRDELRKKVEKEATTAFKSLTTEGSYLGLRINENYGLVILDELGEEVPVRSAGAEQIVALSLICGLNNTGRGAGPIIMDTPFGRLDPNHRGNILAHLPQTASQFILLVHEGELDREKDLRGISEKVANVYDIKRISSTQSVLERARL